MNVHSTYCGYRKCGKDIAVEAGPILGLILGLHPANERRRYKVTPSLIGWAQYILGFKKERW